MRIVHLLYALTTGGAEMMLVDIANEQCKKDDVHVVVINNKVNLQIKKKFSSRIIFHFINKDEGSKSLIKVVELNILLIRLRPSIIHCHTGTLINWIIFKPCPVCRTIHSTGAKAINNTCKKYDSLISISSAVDNELREKVGISSTIVANGISCDKVRVKSRGEKQNSFRIVQISRLVVNHKGQDILIKAVAELVKQGIHDITVDFIGEGESRNELEKLADDLQIAEYVNFMGLKDRDYVYEHLSDYSLLVQPSRFEGFGLTVAEAITARIPVLVSDIEGPLEIIEQGRYGMSFKNEDYQDCSRKIKLIYNGNYEIDLDLARNRIIEKYGILNTIAGYYKVYHDTIR